MPAAAVKASSAALMLSKASSGSSTASSLLTANTIDGTRSRFTSSEWRRVCGSSSQLRVLPLQLGRVDQHHGGVGAGGGRDHVARVLLVARRVADDELAAGRGEVAVGHVDGDALFALGRQAVGEQRQVGLARALHAGQLVLQHRLAVHQQAADQRALAVVDAAAGDEAQRGHVVMLACTAVGLPVIRSTTLIRNTRPSCAFPSRRRRSCRPCGWRRAR